MDAAERACRRTRRLDVAGIEVEHPAPRRPGAHDVAGDQLVQARRALEASLARYGLTLSVSVAPLTSTRSLSFHLGTGEAPELARAVFARLGIERIEWVEVQFGSLIPQLRTGRYDVIAAGMYVTPARAQQIAFSRPSFCTHAVLLVRRDDPLDLHGYADVARAPAARLAVLAGAVEGDAALAAGVPAARIAVYPDAAAAAPWASLVGAEDAASDKRPVITWPEITLLDGTQLSTASWHG